MNRAEEVEQLVQVSASGSKKDMAFHIAIEDVQLTVRIAGSKLELVILLLPYRQLAMLSHSYFSKDDIISWYVIVRVADLIHSQFGYSMNTPIKPHITIDEKSKRSVIELPREVQKFLKTVWEGNDITQSTDVSVIRQFARVRLSKVGFGPVS